MEKVIHKTCKICRETKPATQSNFNYSELTEDGYKVHCKKCDTASINNRQRKNNSNDDGGSWMTGDVVMF